jgi:predicted  nucleic acid-binding Zn-ribbon protein
MPTLKHSCETCDSSFSISYNDLECEDSPHYCPFCGEYLIDELDLDSEDD